MTPESTSCKNCQSPAKPATELLHFLELSISMKTDAYLLQLSLLAASTQGIGAMLGKNKPITAMVTVSKSILLPIHHWAGSEFTLMIDEMSHPLRHQTWEWYLNSEKGISGNVIFWNPELDADGIFSLSFSEIQQEFKIAPSLLHLHQEFDAKVLAIGREFVELSLVEKLAVS